MKTDHHRIALIDAATGTYRCGRCQHTWNRDARSSVPWFRCPTCTDHRSPAAIAEAGGDER